MRLGEHRKLSISQQLRAFARWPFVSRKAVARSGLSFELSAMRRCVRDVDHSRSYVGRAPLTADRPSLGLSAPASVAINTFNPPFSVIADRTVLPTDKPSNQLGVLQQLFDVGAFDRLQSRFAEQASHERELDVLELLAIVEIIQRAQQHAYVE